MTAYYNEFDPKAAAWLRELIRCGHIAPGDVDERSIEDVTPADLAGYTQVHMFAGIGVWSYALRCAGWADTRPVWTGSCPCQPFSAAGKGGGFADERHLWPAAHHLIAECRPPVVIGEQVASKDGLGWFDLVQADLEGTGYACGAVDLCAAGVGAPHIRQRLWWVAERLDNPAGARHLGPVGRPEGLARNEAWLRLPGAGSGPDLVERPSGDGRIERRAEPGGRGAASGRGLVGLADDDDDDAGLEGQPGHGDGGREPGRVAPQPAGPGGAGGGSGGLADAHGRDACAERQQRGGEQRQQPQDGGTGGVAEPWKSYADWFGVCWHSDCRDSDRNGCDCHKRTDGPAGWYWDDDDGWVADAHDTERRPIPARRDDSGGPDAGRAEGPGHAEGRGRVGRPGPTNGLWRDADWLFCRDGKWRPVEPGTFPLAHGAPARVGRLRGYGNAIVAPAATAFIEACMDSFRLTDVSGVTTDKTDKGVFG